MLVDVHKLSRKLEKWFLSIDMGIWLASSQSFQIVNKIKILDKESGEPMKEY